ncbi:dTDP-glucose 4,6-dehydratase [Sinosporangium album]|uniref:dTDP-glucose 4,6-dehydratase n=1 Tax=Sinosporangium album TaxID=504805 RepID=A0A1G7ZD81_9ACTN|nr:dTDP-glucose 4,6-dehydratase [Sinosporangium album]SDH06701.1 dTDP-glucose 4,6-dehydratase [Sinosporangium album]
MRMLVTGGAGFIGSNLIRQTLAGVYPWLADHEIVVLDKLTYAGTRESLLPVAGDPRLTFVHGDICDIDLVAEVMTGVSLVVHCAAESHVDRSIAGADDFVRTNITGTHVLIEAARRAGVDKFVLVSTDEVYGTTDEGTWTEDAPLRPNSPYAASKAAADLLARAFHQTHGFPVTVTRCSNNYGPYQFPEKLIPLFATNLLDGEPVPLYGDGGHVREWIHVDDHCRGIALVADRGRPGEVYHFGGTDGLTNLTVTEAVLKALGADWSMVDFVADRKGHDRRYSVDCGKARTELGFRPTIGFSQGLIDTVKWYADNRAWWEPLKKRERSRRRDSAQVPTLRG